MLVVHLFGKLTNVSTYHHYMKVLTSSLTVLLFSLSKVKPLVNQEKVHVFPRIQGSLQDWIVNPNVIGGSVFGGDRKGSKEVEVT